MSGQNLRHLRAFLAVADTCSVKTAAHRCRVSQPAVTQALQKLERTAGGALFERTRKGFFATPRGMVLGHRVRRAFDRLDPALGDVAPRLILTATAAQLQALIAVHEAQNFTIAARRLGLAQPTVHRAVSQLEGEAARPLFERASHGIVATRSTRALALAARLAFAELDQAAAELADLNGEQAGRVVIGALPLSRSALLPRALSAFRTQRSRQKVTVIDGVYDELLNGLRRGEIDVIIGAMRDPVPIADITQETLFEDSLSIVARPGHPLAERRGLTAAELFEFPVVVARSGTPARDQFDQHLAQEVAPKGVIETGSILLMRGILLASDHLGCVSTGQAGAEVSGGMLVRLDVPVDWPGRPIGLTTRSDWIPTRAQALLIDLIRDAARQPLP